MDLNCQASLIPALGLCLFLWTGSLLHAQVPCNQPAGFTYIGSLDGNEYFRSNYGLYPAQIFADAVANGGHAVTISSAEENELVRQGLLWFSFIGLTDIADQGNFSWSTGEPLDFTNWGPYEPGNTANEDYVEMNPYNGVWNDIYPWLFRAYVMEIEGEDSDCDGVADNCDQWPGCDDNLDSNQNGIPDCVDTDLVLESACGKKGNKVTICHIPPGNPANRHNICVSPNAAADHFAHGDYLGECEQVSCSNSLAGFATNALIARSEGREAPDFTIYPNPSSGDVRLDIHHSSDEPMTITIFDYLGRSVFQFPEQPIVPGTYHLDLRERDLPDGLYYVTLQTAEERQVKTLVLTR